MCTVSWSWEDDGLSIYFSRDERRTRLAGLPPKVFKAAPHRFICPTDQDRGGTWFAANDTGLVIGLLNDYHGTMPATPGKSRGHLVRDLATFADAGCIDQMMADAVESNVYPPFTLLAWFGDEVKMWRYPDQTLTLVHDVSPPITSSSWQTDRVEPWRKSLFAEKVVAEGWSLDRYHRYEVPGDRESSVCMTRPETRTVSLTTCRVGRHSVEMDYFDRDDSGKFGSAQHASLPINLLL